MGRDITRIPEEQLLEVLGEGDWHLTLPIDAPNLVVSLQWRQVLVSMACMWFVRWVLAGTYIEIVHDDDPPWDHSGSPRHYYADPLTLLARYDLLETWLSDEYTCVSMASYVSGMGLFWETYGEKLRDEIQDRIHHLLKGHWLQTEDHSEDLETWEDTIWEALVMVDLSLQQALMLHVNRVSTAYAWDRFQAAARAQIAKEQREAKILEEEYALMRERVRGLWQQHFNDLTGQRIEYPQFDAMALEARIKDVLADADPWVVEAVAKLGLPGIFSNSVRDAVRRIARDVANTS